MFYIDFLIMLLKIKLLFKLYENLGKRTKLAKIRPHSWE
ncbi:hypothetical protein P20495_1907 [Pseudoalteromonas sp. BSi20495]|nr:hypothetical protein P20495_1907 [Pseudoalteromonas sp. BSi20495]